MFKRLQRVICAVAAAAVMAAVSVTAAADHTYQLGDSLCDEIKADFRDISGSEGTFETKFGDSTQDKYLSLRFKLFNEYLDSEFWNNDDVMVSVDVKLETEGADIIGCIPGFNDNWGWVNPSDYTKLKYGEWVTVSETGKHFYPEFSKSAPAYVLFQARTNWGAAEQGDVKISVRNFRITGGSAAQPVETTTSATTTTAATTTEYTTTATTTVAEEVSEEPTESVEITGESSQEQTSSEEATTTGSDSTSAPEDTSKAPDSTTAATNASTSISTNATKATSSEINYNDLYKTESPIMMIVIIVGIAAVISVGAVVGYLIYRKKKYY